MLTRAFGVPVVPADALRDVSGIIVAYLYGSWAFFGCHIRTLRVRHRRAWPPSSTCAGSARTA